MVSRAGTAKLVHRVAYEIAFGEIAPGLSIDHKCHERTCVNPAHLQAVTNKQNQENRSGATSRSVSGIRGVSWSERLKKYRVRVSHNGREYSGGCFVDIREAEAAAVDLRTRLFTNNLVDRRQQLQIARDAQQPVSGPVRLSAGRVASPAHENTSTTVNPATGLVASNEETNERRAA